MKAGFSFVWRNYGHWDVYPTVGPRAFRIRGEPGDYIIFDERDRSAPVRGFRTVAACAAWICDHLMWENLQLVGSDPVVIDSNGNPPPKVTA